MLAVSYMLHLLITCFQTWLLLYYHHFLLIFLLPLFPGSDVVSPAPQKKKVKRFLWQTLRSKVHGATHSAFNLHLPRRRCCKHYLQLGTHTFKPRYLTENQSRWYSDRDHTPHSAPSGLYLWMERVQTTRALYYLIGLTLSKLWQHTRPPAIGSSLLYHVPICFSFLPLSWREPLKTHLSSLRANQDRQCVCVCVCVCVHVCLGTSGQEGWKRSRTSG